MTLKRYLDEKTNLAAENRLLKWGFVCLLVGFAVQGFWVHRALRYQRTILVPPTVTTRMEFVGDRASPEYLREFARYVSGLALNATPQTASAQFSELLSLYSPKTYAVGKRTFERLAKQIQLGKASTVFYPLRVAVKEDSRKIEIAGERKLYADEVLVERGRKDYVLAYEVVDGRFQILGLAEKEGEKGLDGLVGAADSAQREGEGRP